MQLIAQLNVEWGPSLNGIGHKSDAMAYHGRPWHGMAGHGMPSRFGGSCQFRLKCFGSGGAGSVHGHTDVPSLV